METTILMVLTEEARCLLHGPLGKAGISPTWKGWVALWHDGKHRTPTASPVPDFVFMHFCVSVFCCTSPFLPTPPPLHFHDVCLLPVVSLGLEIPH